MCHAEHCTQYTINAHSLVVLHTSILFQTMRTNVTETFIYSVVVIVQKNVHSGSKPIVKMAKIKIN